MYNTKVQDNLKDPYDVIFHTSGLNNEVDENTDQLLAFVCFFNVGEYECSEADNALAREKLLSSITMLTPSPHNIFWDEKGYLCRFELPNPIPVLNQEIESNLKKMIEGFLLTNGVVKGKLESLEIGRWIDIPHPFLNPEEDVQCRK